MAMDLFADVVWRILLEMDVQTKYSNWSSDAMPKPKRKYLLDEKAWTDLLDAVQEAVKRLKAQAAKEATVG